MKELEVGMYAYSKHSRDYGIGKIVKIHTNGFSHQEVEIQYKDIKISTRYDYVIGSHNPIDLIEKRDYVNGYKVVEIIKDFKVIVDKLELNTSDGNYYLKSFTNNQIKNIVTKEQFESMKYIIEK